MIVKARKRLVSAAESVIAKKVAAKHFLGCLNKARRINAPFEYWLLNDILPAFMLGDLASLPFHPPQDPVFNGRRESNNSSRVYFTSENQKLFPVCGEMVALFSDAAVIKALESLTHADLSKGQLRIEYCQDVDGFWLEPHLDISVKYFTMLIYLSDDPNLFDAGTDIFDSTSEHRLVASAPYERNAGLIFIPGKNTWHGFAKRPIRGLRKSLIINYVSPDWLSKGELAYQ